MKKLFVLFILAALFALLVWPMRYRQYPRGEGPYAAQFAGDAPSRVDRITGDIAVQDASGQWHHVGNVRKSVAFEQPAVDPGAMRSPSLRENERVVDQQRRSIDNTQDAVNRQGKE